MKALAIVVAFGLALGWWWTRDSKGPQRAAPAEASAPTKVARRTTPRPELDKFRPPTKKLALTPTTSEPRKYEDVFRHDLQAFVDAAKLTDAQEETLLADISELAAIDASAYYRAAETGNFEGVSALNDELGYELEARIAEYMAPQQQAEFRFRLHADALISQARRLYYLPTGP